MEELMLLSKNMLMEHIRLTFNFTDLVRNFWNGFPATALTLRCRRNCFFHSGALQ